MDPAWQQLPYFILNKLKQKLLLLSHSSVQIILGLRAGEESTHIQAIGVKDKAQENHPQGPDRFAGTNSSLPASESGRKTNKSD